MLRDPLTRFLAMGLLLFLVYNWLGNASTGEDVIVVDESALARFLSFRDPRLAGDAAMNHLRTLDEEDRSRLVENYVREEVLYREALAMGLDENDSAAKRRLIAQLEYLNQGIAYDTLELSEADVAEHYSRNNERYRAPARISFTHVFLSAETDGPDPLGSANAELRWLNETSLPFHEAASRGDHFPYHRNYVDKSPDQVAAHFGTAFADDLFALEEGPRWQGPIPSAYGLHLVLIASRKPEHQRPLEEIRARVAEDLARERVRSALDGFYESARERYRIVVSETETEP